VEVRRGMTVGELIKMLDGVDRGLPVFVEVPELADVFEVLPTGWEVCTFEEDSESAGVVMRGKPLG
jgi:hypothetical protein